MQNLAYNDKYMYQPQASQLMDQFNPNRCLDSGGTHHMNPFTASLSKAQPYAGYNNPPLVIDPYFPSLMFVQVLYQHTHVLLI